MTREQEKQEALDRLKAALPVGTTIYTSTIHHVHKTGNCVIMVLIAGKNAEGIPEILNIGPDVSRVINCKWNHRGGVWNQNDYDVVHQLSWALYQKSYAFPHARL